VDWALNNIKYSFNITIIPCFQPHPELLNVKKFDTHYVVAIPKITGQQANISQMSHFMLLSKISLLVSTENSIPGV
jgi:hypothetical protein